MGGKMARDKGKRFEREIANYFKDNGYPEAKRAQQFAGGVDSADVIGVPFIHIECKAQEKMQMYNWMEQAIRDSAGKKLPVVISKQNNKERLATMLLDDWIEVYKAYEQSSRRSD